MPTVIVVDGFAVRVNIIEDGEGPHVHVVKGGREKTTQAEARRAAAIVRDNLAACWKEWKKWHT